MIDTFSCLSTIEFSIAVYHMYMTSCLDILLETMEKWSQCGTKLTIGLFVELKLHATSCITVNRFASKKVSGPQQLLIIDLIHEKYMCVTGPSHALNNRRKINLQLQWCYGSFSVACQTLVIPQSVLENKLDALSKWLDNVRERKLRRVYEEKV